MPVSPSTSALGQSSDTGTGISHLSAQLAEARRELAELRSRDALKTQFLFNTSHDLRTPLTAIITHGEILRDGLLGPLSHQQQSSVEHIITGGRQLLAMISEILTYARGAADRLRLTRNEFYIEDVIVNARSLNDALMQKRKIQCETHVTPTLPPLNADREKITHVINNLLGNAIEFTPEGGKIWIRASATVDQNQECQLIEVGDTGIGIAHEHFDLIFDEFAQVDASASRAHHGTGLGLCISRTLVELHGGRIWLESTIGHGSRFYFTVPYAQTPHR